MTNQPMSAQSNFALDELVERLHRLGVLPTQIIVDDAVLADGIAAFQRSRGLDATGVLDTATISALEEATFTFGDRPIYLTSPMLRGDDVSWLQLRLGSLGFNAGRVDGIFGPNTQRALCEFQRNVDLVVDGVCGRDTVAQLNRLSTRMGDLSVAGIRESEALLARASDLSGLRVSVVSREADATMAGAIASSLSVSDAAVAVHTSDDWSELAVLTNRTDADLCIALELIPESILDIAYFGTDGFESHAGRALAEALLRQLPQTPQWGERVAQGMRLPILRETRCPTVRVRVGPASEVVELQSMIVAAVGRTVRSWIGQPFD